MLPIIKMISKYNHYNYNSIEYIVVHDTGNYKDSAKNNAIYFNGGNRGASAHYFIDDVSIYQIVENNNGSWHCGDGAGRYGITNTNSIGIEMCNSGGYISEITIKNTIELVKHLMKKYNISIDKVVRHYDASRKICPYNMSQNNWAKWNEFKKKLSEKHLNPYVKLDGGGTIVSNNLAINLIIKDYKDVDRVFGYLEGIENALWAFDINPPNANYAKLKKNANQVAVYKGLKPNTEYKILVFGYKDGKKVTETSIVLKTLEQQEKVEEKLYRVQTGAFANKKYAENLRDELKEKGYKDTYIQEE